MDESIFEGVHCYLPRPGLDNLEDGDGKMTMVHAWMGHRDTQSNGDKEKDTPSMDEGDLDPVSSKSTLVEPSYKGL